MKALNEMTIRAIAAESKVELFEARIKDKEQTIGAQLKTIGVLETQLTKSQENRADAGKIFTGDARMLEQANGIIAKQDAEIAKLRNPGFFASIFDKRTAYGLIGGYGACKLTSGSSPTISIPGLNSQYQQMFVQSPEDRVKALRFR